MSEIDFTGERFVPGRSPVRIARDHFARYEFAAARALGLRVLDIACGVGYGSALCSSAGARSVDGVDLCHAAVAKAERDYGRPGIRFLVNDIGNYTARDPYDLIICYETIEHVSDFNAALGNLWTLLKPSGTLLISSPNRILTSPRAGSMHDTPNNRFHVHEFTIEEMMNLLAAHGFVVSETYGQRQQRTFRSARLTGIYSAALATKHTAAYHVWPVRTKTPRYFVIEATKAEGGAP